MEGWVLGTFGRFNYLAPFVVLFLCGIGLPIPEEVTLIASGLLVHRGQVDFLEITCVCSAAILMGDAIPYVLGRRYGMSALKVRWVRRIIHPERFARLERRFERHGNWAVFACRFFAGVRIPGYFLAGTMRMSFGRFLLLDALGVVVSVPVSIWLGMIFAEQVDRLQESFRSLHLVLAFAILCLALVLIVRGRRRRGSEGGPGSGTGGDNPS